jgi:DNA replication protein DnaC
MERLSEAIQKTGITQGNMAKSLDQNDAINNIECLICKDTGWVRYPVGVEDESFGKIYPCKHREEEIKSENSKRLQRYSNLGGFENLNFENTKPKGIRDDTQSQKLFSEAFLQVQEFTQSPEGWIILSGPSGVGKTHLAALIAHERLKNNLPALFVFIPDLLDHLRSAYAPGAEIEYDSLFQQVKDAPFLVMDDLGAQSTTPWAQEKLFQILNHRFVNKMITVITIGDALEHLEKRIQSRIEDRELSKVLVLGEERLNWINDDVLNLPLFKEMTMDNFSPDRNGSAELSSGQRASLNMAYVLSKKYAQNPEGWMLLMGENGVGKTHLAASIAHYSKEKGKKVLFLVVPDLLDHLRYTFRPDSDVSYDELFEEVKRVEMLVLDDLGAHGTTPWAREKLYQIINYRYVARLPLVVTTNLSLDELERAEPRIASRLADTRNSVPFHIDAPNYGVTLNVRK